MLSFTTHDFIPVIFKCKKHHGLTLVDVCEVLRIGKNQASKLLNKECEKVDLKLLSNKQELLRQKDAFIKDLDTLFNDLINDDTSYKRAALLYYWLRDYKNYIKNEKKFDYKYLPAYQRGNIVNVNLGYNLGSESGGMHFAVVLAESRVTNPNITITPLKSKKDLLQPTTNTPFRVRLGQRFI